MLVRYSILKKGISVILKKQQPNKIIYTSSIRSFAMSAPVVQVKQGKLKGAIRDNIDGGEYYSFRGVPYAEPPVGDLRFKEPQELKPWIGIRDALNESKMSAQNDSMLGTQIGDDDCLYLDIATNSLSGKSPVMVWIHGGAFKMSSNTYKKYGPDYLLKKDIVYAALNYRLGILGFLNMEHEDCPGNQGLKDQVAALKWIKENIHVFGGDPNNITIFGESAGGVSVHALCISPEAKGLFHKAITQSGVLSNPWAHISSNKQFGFALAKLLGKDCSTSEEVIQFLRTIPVMELVEQYDKINKSGYVNKLLLTLVPSVDAYSKNPLLPKEAESMEMNGIDVPFLIGYNSHEGIIRFLQNKIDYKEINDNFTSLIVQYLRINDIDIASKFAKKIRDFYFGSEEITERKINELVQFYGDFLFVYDILKVAYNQAQKSSPTYLYKFSYRPDCPCVKDRFNVKIEGTCHGDEMSCLFYAESRREKFLEGTRDRTTMERMTTMWTNFAKTGNPTPEINDLITTKWLPLDKNKKHYLSIDDNLTSGTNPDNEIFELWHGLKTTLLSSNTSQ